VVLLFIQCSSSRYDGGRSPIFSLLLTHDPCHAGGTKRRAHGEIRAIEYYAVLGERRGSPGLARGRAFRSPEGQEHCLLHAAPSSVPNTPARVTVKKCPRDVKASKKSIQTICRGRSSYTSRPPTCNPSRGYGWRRGFYTESLLWVSLQGRMSHKQRALLNVLLIV